MSHIIMNWMNKIYKLFPTITGVSFIADWWVCEWWLFHCTFNYMTKYSLHTTQHQCICVWESMNKWQSPSPESVVSKWIFLFSKKKNKQSYWLILLYCAHCQITSYKLCSTRNSYVLGISAWNELVECWN